MTRTGDDRTVLRIALIDPAVANDINLGDHIISAAVRRWLIDDLGLEEIVRVPSIHPLNRDQRRRLRRADVVLVGGTNLLSSNMDKYNQWKVNLVDLVRLPRVVLMGVGWWQYQEPPNLYTRILLRGLLDRRLLHSVRDEYAAQMLASAGIRNVVNTSCPTLWQLEPDDLGRLPLHRAREVVCTLTCYNMKPEYDRPLLELLDELYDRVILWPQGNDDLEYARELGVSFDVVPHTVGAFDELLEESPDVDYVGTRLHAGVRALQNHKRALILGIDNRAMEIAGDTGLPVIPRDELAAIRQWIHSSDPVHLTLPRAAIKRWLGQFAPLSG
jgi:polysaccharide pyruvyl transferase WcaK-like protein